MHHCCRIHPILHSFHSQFHTSLFTILQWAWFKRRQPGSALPATQLSVHYWWLVCNSVLVLQLAPASSPNPGQDQAVGLPNCFGSPHSVIPCHTIRVKPQSITEAHTAIRNPDSSHYPEVKTRTVLYICGSHAAKTAQRLSVFSNSGNLYLQKLVSTVLQPIKSELTISKTKKLFWLEMVSSLHHSRALKTQAAMPIFSSTLLC